MQFEGGEGKNAWKWSFLFDVTAYVLKWTVRGNEVRSTCKTVKPRVAISFISFTPFFHYLPAIFYPLLSSLISLSNR